MNSNPLHVLVPILITALSCLTAKSQPSCYVHFSFRLYDSTGAAVDYDTFYENYEALGMGNRKDFMPWNNEYLSKESFYNDSTMTFFVSGSVVYNPLIRKIVYGGDTMELVVPFPGRKCYIDSLVFRPGHYCVGGRVDYITDKHSDDYKLMFPNAPTYER